MSTRKVFTRGLEVVLQEVECSQDPSALLQGELQQLQAICLQASLTPALSDLKTLANQVQDFNSPQAHAWKTAVDEGLLGLLAAALSNSLCALDTAALQDSVELQPGSGQHQAESAARSPKQVAVVAVHLLISTLSNSLTAYVKATPLSLKPPHMQLLPGAAAAAMQSCGLITGLAALCDRISAALEAERGQRQQQQQRSTQQGQHQQQQQQQPARQDSEPPLTDTCAEATAASVLQLVQLVVMRPAACGEHMLARHWPNTIGLQQGLLQSTENNPFQPLLQASMHLAVSVLASHQAAAAEAAAAVTGGSAADASIGLGSGGTSTGSSAASSSNSSGSSGRGGSTARPCLATVAKAMRVSGALMRAGSAAVDVANQVVGEIALLPDTFHVPDPGLKGSVDPRDAVILGAAAASTRIAALHQYLRGMSPSVSCADATAALRSAGGSDGSGSADMLHRAAPHPQQQQQAGPSALVVPPLHEDMLLALGIPWATAPALSMSMQGVLEGPAFNEPELQLEDAAYTTTLALGACLNAGCLQSFDSITTQEFKSKSPEELGEAAVAPLLPFDALPFPFPTELYLPMVGLLIEAPLMLKGRRWQEMLHINLGMVQRVQTFRDNIMDETMVMSAKPSGGPSDFDLLVALRAPSSTLKPFLQLLAPAVLQALDETTAQAAKLPPEHPLVQRRLNMVNNMALAAISFEEAAAAAATGACVTLTSNDALADVVSFWLEVPITAARAMQACMRTYACNLPDLQHPNAHIKFAYMPQEVRDSMQHHYDRLYAAATEGNTAWADQRSDSVYQETQFFIDVLHCALLSSEQFAAAVGTLAMQPPLLLQLAEQLHGMLCTCLKCCVVGSRSNVLAVLVPCLPRAFKLMVAVTLGILQKHRATLGQCATSAAASATGTNTHSSRSSQPGASKEQAGKVMQQAQQTTGQQVSQQPSSSLEKGSSGSGSSSSAISDGGEPHWDTGSAYWLGIFGRASILAGQLLLRLRDIISVLAAGRWGSYLLMSEVVQALLEELPRTLAALQQILQPAPAAAAAELHVSAQHADVQDSSDDTRTDTAHDRQGPLAEPGAAAVAQLSSAAAKMQEMAAKAAQHLADYSKASGSDHMQHLAQLSGVLCNLGAEVNSTFPRRTGCNNPGCTNLQQMSEELLVAGGMCTNCRAAAYCGKVCQKSQWNQHRAICKQLQLQGISDSSKAVPS